MVNWICSSSAVLAIRVQEKGDIILGGRETNPIHSLKLCLHWHGEARFSFKAKENHYITYSERKLITKKEGMSPLESPYKRYPPRIGSEELKSVSSFSLGIS